MILDIKYLNRPPEQVQKVRMITVYVQGEPELVIQFEDYVSCPRYITLRETQTIQVTND